MTSKYGNVSGWVEVGGQRFYAKSKSEYRFALYLDWLKTNGNIKEWFYEPCEYLIKGRSGTTKIYKPDFMVRNHDESHELFEVKGFMTKVAQAKINAFRKQYPDKVLTVIDSKWFSRNSGKLKNLVPGWA